MGLSRRQWLKALAAMPLTACSGRPAGRRIAGSIVGAAHARGHRLREQHSPAPTRRESASVVIAGGGIAGLSAAWRLARAGFDDFLVFELEDLPGGTSRGDLGPVVPHPWGAHYVPVPDPANRPLVALLEEVGVVAGRNGAGQPIWAEEVLCAEPQERLFYRGEWHEGLYPRAGASRGDVAELERFHQLMRDWSRFRDQRGRPAFTLPRARGSRDPQVVALDALSMAEWLAREGFSSERLRWFVEHACRDDFGSRLEETSAWAGLHYFASRLDPQSGESAELLTWPEGNARLAHHLAAVAGARLRTGSVVLSAAQRGSALNLEVLEVESGIVSAVEAGHAILALPRHVTARVIEDWRLAPPAFLNDTTYGSWAVINLWLRDRPPARGFPLAWDNVIHGSESLGYVVATHQLGRDRGPTVFTWYFPLTDRDARAARGRLLASTWEEWVERALADLGPSHPGIRALVERADVWFWGHAMVRPRPGFMCDAALDRGAEPLGCIHFAHTDLSGMALVEEAQYHGIRAAEEVLTSRGHEFRSWLD